MPTRTAVAARDVAAPRSSRSAGPVAQAPPAWRPLPFSNAAHYANPEVDSLLEAAGIEPDEQKRWQLFSDFQKLIAKDLPAINTVAPKTVLAYNRRVHDFALGAEGDKRSFADAWIEQ